LAEYLKIVHTFLEPQSGGAFAWAPSAAALWLNTVFQAITANITPRCG
jgi:predicted aconitase